MEAKEVYRLIQAYNKAHGIKPEPKELVIDLTKENVNIRWPKHWIGSFFSLIGSVMFILVAIVGFYFKNLDGIGEKIKELEGYVSELRIEQIIDQELEEAKEAQRDKWRNRKR